MLPERPQQSAFVRVNNLHFACHFYSLESTSTVVRRVLGSRNERELPATSGRLGNWISTKGTTQGKQETSWMSKMILNDALPSSCQPLFYLKPLQPQCCASKPGMPHSFASVVVSSRCWSAGFMRLCKGHATDHEGPEVAAV